MKYIKVYYTLSPVTNALSVVVDATEVGHRTPLMTAVEADQVVDAQLGIDAAFHEAEKLIAALHPPPLVVMGQFRMWDDAEKKWVDTTGHVYERYNEPHPDEQQSARLMHFHVEYLYEFDAYVPEHLALSNVPEEDGTLTLSPEFNAWCAETADRNPFGDKWPEGVSWSGTTVTDSNDMEVFEQY